MAHGARGRPYRDVGHQEELGVVGAAIDGFMDELAVRQEHQWLLVNELNHRVKNTLATVQFIAMQTFRGDEQGLARELNGEVRLDYNAAGLVCTVDVPLPDLEAGKPTTPPLIKSDAPVSKVI